MLTEEDYENLPDDSELAFVHLERRLRAALVSNLESSQSSNASEVYYVDYINGVLAIREALGIQVPHFLEIPESNSELWDTYRNATVEIDRFAIKVGIDNAKGRRRFSVVLSNAEKQKIRHHIEQIKLAIEESNLAIDKKEALYKQLSELSLEVDRDRTKLEIVAYQISRMAEAAEPFWKWVKPIFEIIGAAKEKEERQSLPRPEERKRIEPPKSVPKPTATLDDEIPF